MVGLGQINKNQRGLSLLEAMISLLILLTGVLGLAAAFQNQIFQISSAKNQGTAAVIAQTVATEMMSMDTSEWNKTTLASLYAYDYEGNRLGAGSETPYYTVDIDWEEESNLFKVDIGVVWTGWKAEGEKVNLVNDQSNFAYILNLVIARSPGG